MSTYSKIKSAIENKQIITADYEGHNRQMCPHILGEKDGHIKALFYQFGGSSQNGISMNKIENWICIPINDLTNVEIVEGRWHTANNYPSYSNCVDEIDFMVHLKLDL